MANNSKDFLISLALQFVMTMSAKANVICSTNNKKTICPEHVLEALSDSKLTQILAPVLDAPTFSKLSFNKQKELVLEKLNASEF